MKMPMNKKNFCMTHHTSNNKPKYS